MVDAGSTADRAKEQMQDTAQVAQEKVQETAETARARLRQQVDQRSTQAGGQVRATAQALRSSGQRLREDGQDGPARAAERAADQAEKVGGWLEQSDADRILRDVEDFGCRQPLAVAAIGLAAGFAASRFLKASSRSRYTQGPTEREWQRHAAIEPQSTGPVVPVGAGTANGLS
jgi:gas vesicle protein